MPPQPKRGRKRREDRQVLNSLIYRLKTGCRYRDSPRTSHYAAPSTTHYWLTRSAFAGSFSLSRTLLVKEERNADATHIRNR